MSQIQSTNKENQNPFPKVNSNAFNSWTSEKNNFLKSSNSLESTNFNEQKNQVISKSKTQVETYDLLNMDPIELIQPIKNPNWSDFTKWNDFSAPKQIEKPSKNLKILQNDNKITKIIFFEDEDIRQISEKIMRKFDISQEFYFEYDSQIFFLSDLKKMDLSQTYTISETSKNFNLLFNSEDRSTKLKTEINAKSHIELLKGIDIVKEGIHILKITSKGKINFRFFQLSPDEQYITWYSSNKLKDETEIHLCSILDINIGQKTKMFQKMNLHQLSHLSFSVKFKDCEGNEKIIDAICKNEFEYDTLLCVLKGLSNFYKKWKISKNVLLGHSSFYNKIAKDNNLFKCEEFFNYLKTNKKEKVDISDCLLIKDINEKNLLKSLIDIEKKHNKIFNTYPTGGIIKNLFLKTDKKQIFEIETLKKIYTRFCKNLKTVQNELNQFCYLFEGKNSNFLINIQEFLGGNLTKNNLEENLFNIRPKNSKNEQDLQNYYNLINKEVWLLNLDIEAIKDITERVVDINYKRNKVGKFGDKLGEKLEDSLTGLTNIFTTFGKSIEKAINNIKEEIDETTGPIGFNSLKS